MYAEAAAIEDDNVRKSFTGHIRSSENLFRRKAMVELAQPEVPVAIDDLDPDPMLLTVRNGTVDLRNGKLRPSRQSDMITKEAGVTYDGDAECPQFETFMQEIFADDQSLISFVQRSLGYSLTGSTREQALFVCHGNGSNGKSTLLGVVQRILGAYGISTPTATILKQRNDHIPNDIARLRGARFTTLSEIEEGRHLNEEVVKNLTGGDIVSARFLNAEYFDFEPVCKIWFSVNSKPRVSGTNHAIWRRIRLIPFAVQIPDDKQDKGLPAALDSEASGILNWLIAGCLAWQKIGLDPPELVTLATKVYRSEEDVLADFIDDCIANDTGLHLPSASLFAAYVKWAEAQKEKPRTQRWFTLRMEGHGYVRQKDRTGRYWLGIALKIAASET